MVTVSYRTTLSSTLKPAIGRNMASQTPTPPLTSAARIIQYERNRSLEVVRTRRAPVTPTNTPIAEVR